MNHSAQLFIFPLFWWEHWVCLKLLIKTNTGRPHTHTCLFSPALEKKKNSPSGGDVQSPVSLGMEFALPSQCLIKKALCTLSLPPQKVFVMEQATKPTRSTCSWDVNSAGWLLFHQPPRWSRGPWPTTSPVSVLLAQRWCASPPTYSAEQWKDQGALCSSSRLWKLVFHPRCQTRAKSCLLLIAGCPGIEDTGAIFSSRNLTSPERLVLETSQSCWGSSPCCSFPQKQPPKARSTAAFLLPHGEDVPSSVLRPESKGQSTLTDTASFSRLG